MIQKKYIQTLFMLMLLASPFSSFAIEQQCSSEFSASLDDDIVVPDPDVSSYAYDAFPDTIYGDAELNAAAGLVNPKIIDLNDNDTSSELPRPQPKTFIPTPLPPLKINNALFYAGNDVLEMRGINWFGFDVGQNMVDGLWASGPSTATDFSTIVYSLRLLGFNAIRLPFVFDVLDKPLESKEISCTVASDSDIVKRCKDPSGGNANTNKIPNPFAPRPIKGKDSTCNAYMPNKKTQKGLDRFLWTIEFFVKNGFYVVIDYQCMGREQYPYKIPVFIDKWIGLWKNVMNMTSYNSLLKGRIMIDLLNEPDSMGIGWSPKPRHSDGMAAIYLNTIDALYKLDKTTLFLIEGCGQNNLGKNWGSGIATYPFVTQQYNIDSALTFFEKLSTKPYYGTNIVISPHIYGPSISKSISQDNFGELLYARLHYDFGYLYKVGYCPRSTPNKCQRFPVLIGEFGSSLKNPQDIRFYNDFSYWLKNRLATLNWMMWAYNENSADTGGIVKNNWRDIDWSKIRWLKQSFNLVSLV